MNDRPHVIEASAVYTVEQAARACAVEESTVRAAYRCGELVAVYRGRRPVILGSDLLAWLRAGRRSRRPKKKVQGQPSPAVMED